MTIVKMYDVKMKTTLPDILLDRLDSKTSSIPEVVVNFNFKNYREVHYMCNDDESWYPEDHNVVFKEFVEGSSFEAALVFPLLMPETVKWYVKRAKLGDDWPTAKYVSRGIWEGVKRSVSDYVLKMADFESEFGFEMVADVEVDTLLTTCY